MNFTYFERSCGPYCCMSSGGINDHNLKKLSIKATLINKFKASKIVKAKALTIYLL
jgi:hypothetical protein